MPAPSEPRLARAFGSLQSRKKFATGKDEFVILNGIKKAALVSEITLDEEFVSGGVAQSSAFIVSIGQNICPNKPKKFTDIEVRGNKLQVLGANDVNGVTWEITAGDPSAGQR